MPRKYSGSNALLYRTIDTCFIAENLRGLANGLFRRLASGGVMETEVQRVFQFLAPYGIIHVSTTAISKARGKRL